MIRDNYLYYEGFIFQKNQNEMTVNLISITTRYNSTNINIPEKITGIRDINDKIGVGTNKWENGDYIVTGIESIIKTPPSANIKRRMGKIMNNLTFMSNTSITSVTIPASVTSIGDSAFEGCSKLTSLSFTSTSKVKSIGAKAFKNCS